MRYRMWLFVVALLLLFAVAGCDGVAVEGSGNVVTESRDVSGFSEVNVQGTGIVEIDLTGTESLEIEAEDNLVPLLTTEVKGNRLELGVESGKILDPKENIIFRITAVDLQGVAISGSGDVTAGIIDSEAFEVEISGSGNANLAGTTGDLKVQISGSGKFAGEALEAATGEVNVSGSGDVVVNVTDELKVTISGSGDVKYMGNPRLDTSISGSGDISAQ